MARINKSTLTKLEIIRVATHMFLENGYTGTTIKAICDELEMSSGNLTFYFPTKEHLLAALVDMCCAFQWKMMKEEQEAFDSALMASCLELASMAASCEQEPVARDFYISAYTSPLCLDIIRTNDAERAKAVFGRYCFDYTDDDFKAAEVLVSGIEYAILMATEQAVPLEKRIAGGINAIMSIYGVPEEERRFVTDKVLALDYKKLGKRVLADFRKYVDEVNEQAFSKLLKA